MPLSITVLEEGPIRELSLRMRQLYPRDGTILMYNSILIFQLMFEIDTMLYFLCCICKLSLCTSDVSCKAPPFERKTYNFHFLP